mgnify:CR=1 FL=1
MDEREWWVVNHRARNSYNKTSTQNLPSFTTTTSCSQQALAETVLLEIWYRAPAGIEHLLV